MTTTTKRNRQMSFKRRYRSHKNTLQESLDNVSFVIKRHFNNSCIRHFQASLKVSRNIVVTTLVHIVAIVSRNFALGVVLNVTINSRQVSGCDAVGRALAQLVEQLLLTPEVCSLSPVTDNIEHLFTANCNRKIKEKRPGRAHL